jgi:hypothetical protein
MMKNCLLCAIVTGFLVSLAGCNDAIDATGAEATADGANGAGVSTAESAVGSGWEGCRGTGSRVCAELVRPNYFWNHPECTANTLSCERKFYACDASVCPTPTLQERSDVLTMDSGYKKGEVLRSRNQNYNLVMQTDGNLVVYRTTDGYAVWNSGTNGSGAEVVTLQVDGNLVVYQGGPYLLTYCRPSGGCEGLGGWNPLVAKWDAGTNGSPAGTFLIMQDDANLVMYRPNGSVAWSIR